MNEENTKYQLLDYKLYEKRLEDALKDEELTRLNVQKHLYGYTKYGYEICEYTIGTGPKDLFIVGGTHGSEIIGVDFVTQLFSNIPNLPDYDPNWITLHIIPNQNPEGFDITTQTLKSIDVQYLEKESKDYYLRYRLDNLLNAYINLLNKKFASLDNILITPDVFINTIKESFNEDTWKKSLLDPARGVPELKEVEYIFNNLGSYSDYDSFKSDIFIKLEQIKNTNTNVYIECLVDRLKKSLFATELMEMIFKNNEVVLNNTNGSRLYQERFEDSKIKGTVSKKLSEDVTKAYIEHSIPKGSQVKFDPNGEFVNLNKNREDNPGIEQMKSGAIKYGNSPSNNVLDNDIGPIGTPTVNPNNFEYTKENQVLLSLIDKSMSEGRLIGVLLYHGTGGLVYSTPFATDTNQDYFAYNERLGSAYRNETKYRPMQDKNDTGFGDMLRKQYPGVMLIELSTMGGNPIAPYGDKNNYYPNMINNFNAVNNVIKELNEMIINNQVNFKK